MCERCFSNWIEAYYFSINCRIYQHFITGVMKFYKSLIAFCSCAILGVGYSSAQSDLDSLKKRIGKLEEYRDQDQKRYKDLTFYYSQMYSRDSASNGKLQLSGYIDAYYALYSDQVGRGNYQKFPTSAPRNNNFGLNMLMLSSRYNDKRVRGVFTLQYGEIPDAAWSPVLNMIQEANVGVKLAKNLWLDAGFFRTHIGFESIQPRENIATSIAITTYYEPYYLSGAKLSYSINDKLTIQANVFNGFNTFVAVNRSKSFGLSVNYEPRENFFLTYNNITGNESNYKDQWRTYHNFYSGYKGKHWDLGIELNGGAQQNSGLSDSTKTAYMFSSLLAVRYKMKDNKYAVYARAEIFEDSDEILTGPVLNANHQLVGINLYGVTLGFQVKPMPNSYIRLEYRSLLTERNENIFYSDGVARNDRHEAIASFGVWF